MDPILEKTWETFGQLLLDAVIHYFLSSYGSKLIEMLHMDEVW